MNAVVGAIDRIRITCSDVTKEAVDAIVNAANPQLTNGGGVADAIRRASGSSFQPACDELVAERGPVPVGGAIAFPAISCGIYGYPVAEAAPVALAATLEALERHPLELVRFCFIAERERSAFQQALDALRDT